MVVSKKYNVIDLEKGTLDRSVFTDEQVYQEELEKIFGRAWLMLAHDSLVPNPNDFFLSYMGEDPVIVTRDAKGELHVFLNMCRHRGNRVVRADDGNAKNFMCTYHGWTFSSAGKLVSVPGLQEAYYGELDVERLGLVEAHSDTYAGIIFATWADDAPSLEAYLGDFRWYMDVIYNARDAGMQMIGPVKWPLPVNWKTPVDNGTDFYHGSTSHFSARIARARLSVRPTQATGSPLVTSYASPRRQLAVNGHLLSIGIREADIDAFSIAGHTGQSVSIKSLAAWQQHIAGILPEMERRLGAFRARRLQPNHPIFFPNTFLGLRYVLPRGPYLTEVWSFTVWDKDAPQEIIDALRLLMVHKDNFAGYLEQDDTDNWRQMTDSGRLHMGRKYLSNLSLGVNHPGDPNPQLPGSHSGRNVAEHTQRAYYARWQEFMNAESWADIHIDPISANFEGVATMKS